MKTTMRLLSWIMVGGSVILPALSWADDHLLSIDGNVTVSQMAIVADDGTVSTPLTLSTPAVTFGAGESLAPTTIPVKWCKPGTNGQLEWLDMGPTLVGVSGTLNSPTGDTLALSFTVDSDNYGSLQGICDTEGARSYTSTAGASFSGPNAPAPAPTTYFFGAATVPEPGTIFLLLIGLSALAWIVRKRGRQPHCASA